MPAFDVVDLDELEAEATRPPTSGGEGLELLTIGAPIDGKYEPPSWG